MMKSTYDIHHLDWKQFEEQDVQLDMQYQIKTKHNLSFWNVLSVHMQIDRSALCNVYTDVP